MATLGIILTTGLFFGCKLYRRIQPLKIDENIHIEPKTTLINTTLPILPVTTLCIRQPDDATFGRFFGLMENINKLSFPHDDNDYDFKWEDFENLELLESNSRHQVGKVLHKPSNNVIVIKFLTIPYNRFGEEENRVHYLKMLREIENFRSLWKCPNVVNFYGLCAHEGHALICMELMDLSLKQLYQLAHKCGQKFPEEVIGYIFAKLADALMYCKNKGILHRDIKPANVLANYSGEIKLCDFGESRVLDNSLASSDVGTSVYWPPERFTKGLYDIRSEIWSLGITLIELILGKLPYIINDVISLHAIISSTNFEEIIRIKIQPFYSEVLCDLLKQCTNKVEERPKLEDLMLSRFYKECNDLNQDQIAQFFSLVKEVSSNDKVDDVIMENNLE